MNGRRQKDKEPDAIFVPYCVPGGSMIGLNAGNGELSDTEMELGLNRAQKERGAF